MTTPYSDLTDSSLVIAKRLYDILLANKVALGIVDVWFGDQQLLPHTPAVCVEPGVKRRSLAGAPDMTELEIDTLIFIYHSKVGAEQQQERQNCVAFADAVERYLHINHTRLLSAGGTQITIHGFCKDSDPGYSYKPRTLYNAVQLTWTSLSKTSLQKL